MDAVTSETLPPEPRPATGLVYDGRLGELYALFWRNLLLSLLTLGVFRFWATTRTRRYLWSHMRFQEDRLEYTGTGGEKLWAFAKVLLLVVLLYAVVVALVILVPGKQWLFTLASFGVGLFLALLTSAAPFTALRYRLARTQWRGLGGGARGSALGYGVASLLIGIAVGLTATLLLPWGRMRLAERRIAASRFADVPLGFERADGVAFVPYLGALLLKLVVFAGLIGFGTAVFLATRTNAPNPVRPEVAASLSHWALIVGLLLLRALNRLCNSWFDAAVLRRVMQRTRYLDLRFESRIGGGALLGLRAGNLLITLLTLGFGTPIVRQRCARFVAAGILVTGALDVERLHSESGPPVREAEGLFEAFDVGFLY